MLDKDNVASGFGGTLERGKRPALLVVDFQRAFTQPELSPFASDCDAQLAATNTLISAMRGVGPVFFTSNGYDDHALDTGVWIQKNPGLASLRRRSEHCEVDERLDFDPKLDLLLHKTQASAFFSTPLASLLAVRGIDMVMLAGATTSGCIRASVVDAAQYGFPPFVVEDCVSDRSAAQHQSNLIDMQSKYAEVVSLDDMLQFLSELKHAEERQTAEES